jgi:Holliday junction resolvase RusA-like endonuclease
MFTVAGVPAAKGSRTVGRRRDGSIFTRPAGSREAAWSSTVAAAALAERARHGTLAPPYVVALTFAMPRPARPAHPHPTRGDVDKLTRLVLDALVTGGLLVDDRHVVEVTAVKRWAPHGGEGVHVLIAPAALAPAEAQEDHGGAIGRPAPRRPREARANGSHGRPDGGAHDDHERT